MQTVTSKNTSINKNHLPAVFSKVTFNPGTANLDYGGGRYDNVKEYLKQYDVLNVVYDPFWRSNEDNEKALNGLYDTSTISNVLNVIDCKETRLNAIKTAFSKLKVNGVLYITVFDGNKSGKVSYNKDTCQLNRKLVDYVEEVKEALGTVNIEIKNQVMKVWA